MENHTHTPALHGKLHTTVFLKIGKNLRIVLAMSNLEFRKDLYQLWCCCIGMVGLGIAVKQGKSTILCQVA